MVLEKLQERVKELDRKIKWSLDSGYNQKAADERALLEEAIQEITLLQTNLDLYRSVNPTPRQMTG